MGHTDLLLQDFLKNFNTDSLQRLFPTVSPGDSPTEWPLLSVNVTLFGSGSGVAVSVFVSHIICDASSLLTFVTGTLSNETFQFAETTIYPPPPPSISSQPQESQDNVNLTRKKYVMNRFVFEPSKIVDLKRKADSEVVPIPTRVETIMSLVWRCARNARRSNLVDFPRSTQMYQPMDLRLRVPSTRGMIGNLHTPFFLKKGAESDSEISETVEKFRKGKEEVNEMIKENLQGNTLGQYLMSVISHFTTFYAA